MSDLIETTRSIVAIIATGLACLAFAVGGQARLTPIFTPKLYEEQHKKTTEGLAKESSFLGVSGKQMTYLTGVLNLVIVGGLLWPVSKRITALCGIGYLMFGATGRWRTGRSIRPPVTIMLVLALSML